MSDSPSAVQLGSCTSLTALGAIRLTGCPLVDSTPTESWKPYQRTFPTLATVLAPVHIRSWRPPSSAPKLRNLCISGRVEQAASQYQCATASWWKCTGPAGLLARLRPLGVLLRAEREVLLQQRGEGAGAHQQHRVAAAAAVERHAEALAPVAVVRREQQLRARRAALACRSEPADGRSNALASCPPALSHGGAALLVAGANSLAQTQISTHDGPCRVLGPPHAPHGAPAGRARARCANRSQAAAAPAGPC